MFETTRGYALTEKLVCGMIMISENVTSLPTE